MEIRIDVTNYTVIQTHILMIVIVKLLDMMVYIKQENSMTKLICFVDTYNTHVIKLLDDVHHNYWSMS